MCLQGPCSSLPSFSPHFGLDGSVDTTVPSPEYGPEPHGQGLCSFEYSAQGGAPGAECLFKEGWRTHKQADKPPFLMWAFRGKKNFYFWKKLLWLRKDHGSKGGKATGEGIRSRFPSATARQALVSITSPLTDEGEEAQGTPGGRNTAGTLQPGRVPATPPASHVSQVQQHSSEETSCRSVRCPSGT